MEMGVHEQREELYITKFKLLQISSQKLSQISKVVFRMEGLSTGKSNVGMLDSHVEGKGRY